MKIEVTTKKQKSIYKKALNIQKEIWYKGLELDTTTYFYLTYKYLGSEYDVKNIHSLINRSENIIFDLNLRLNYLLKDNSYLETVYN